MEAPARDSCSVEEDSLLNPLEFEPLKMMLLMNSPEKVLVAIYLWIVGYMGLGLGLEGDQLTGQDPLGLDCQ